MTESSQKRLVDLLILWMTLEDAMYDWIALYDWIQSELQIVPPELTLIRPTLPTSEFKVLEHKYIHVNLKLRVKHFLLGKINSSDDYCCDTITIGEIPIAMQCSIAKQL